MYFYRFFPRFLMASPFLAVLVDFEKHENALKKVARFQPKWNNAELGVLPVEVYVESI